MAGPGQGAVAQGCALMVDTGAAIEQGHGRFPLLGDDCAEQGRAAGTLVGPFKVRAAFEQAQQGRKVAALGGFCQ